MARLEKALPTAHTILYVQGNVAGLLGFSLNATGRIANGSQIARTAGRRHAGMPSAGCVQSDILPSSEACWDTCSPERGLPGRCEHRNASRRWTRWHRHAS